MPLQQDNCTFAIVQTAKALADVVVVSILSSPNRSPTLTVAANCASSLQEDCEQLFPFNIDLIFTPATITISPKRWEQLIYIEVPYFATCIETPEQRAYCRQIATITNKLFNMIQPNIACFSEKNYLRLALICKIVTEMVYDPDIIGVPIIQEPDSLALSAHNAYLTLDERRHPPPRLYPLRIPSAEQLNSERGDFEE